MQLHALSAREQRGGGISRLFDHWFPIPQALYPRSAGVDISDSSIKWLQLGRDTKKDPIIAWGDIPLTDGVVVNGVVKDSNGLAAVLKEVRKKLRTGSVHAALPEEAAYIFGMHVPAQSSRQSILNMIEFELPARVPIPPAEAVYDFDVIESSSDGTGEEIGVVVFPKELINGYVEAFRLAGLELLSLELEARSIARAVSSHSESEPITLLVDFGRARTGFAVLKRGVPIFTSTVNVGGAAMTSVLVDKLALSPADAEAFKNDKGMLATTGEKSPAAEALLSTVSALADEVARHYHYWDTRRNEQGERVTPVEKVLLVGGSANLKGLGDYIAARMQAPVEKPDVWRHVCTFDSYIPPIDRRTSLQYATAVGLALRGI